jgi:ABC-type glycerol-3-phosphate transport system substrate-binding protein
MTVTSIHCDKRLLGLLTACALLLAGCGGGGDSDTAQSTSSTPSATTISPSDMQNEQAPPDRLLIDVTIKGGQVDPTNAQFEVKVNEPIVVKVNSDAADELHVHSNPEHTFKIESKPGAQQFQFTVGVPGKVDIELHQLGTTIATVQVQQ